MSDVLFPPFQIQTDPTVRKPFLDAYAAIQDLRNETAGRMDQSATAMVSQLICGRNSLPFEISDRQMDQSNSVPVDPDQTPGSTHWTDQKL